MPDNRRNMTSKIGLILSFIGMAGLVLSILSLLPLNLYNIYTTIITSYKLLLLNKDWLSPGAKLYLFFLCGSCFSSLFEILATLLACTRHRASQDEHTKNNQSQPTQPPQTKSWFIRIICFTLCLQILFSLIG
ncbi:uncharacterized protein B0P05DRAFT_542310 [Gilbertella persicaria]|uniref:uncharacterized protein n=1 Tax=Gilbertella persicaria TaxID=101096 RepID=UPI00221EEFE0|nr:uncharacterized protein B0P05DRAFT_542310 [Gilbertella persicaria]KAI8079097.1 hypothetical protein B0P05DRAFT_542310 [Gilbertella persicaria]